MMQHLIKTHIIFSCLLLGNLLTAQVNFNVKLDKAQLIIGDQFTATINISAPEGTVFQAINYDPWASEGVELLDIQAIQTTSESPRLLMQQEVKLTSFDTGYHRLPVLEVIYVLNGQSDTARSNNLGLEVMDMKVQEDAPIRENKDIIKEARNWQDAMPYAVGFLLAALLAGLFWWLRKRKRKASPPPPPPPPPIPAHQVAFSKLNALKKKNLWEQGHIKAFQSELTYIFREYLEKRFGLNALEATTSEIKGQLSTIAIDKNQQKNMMDILETADMVKFAKATPPPGIHAKALDNITAFVQDTKKEIEVITENKDTTA